MLTKPTSFEDQSAELRRDVSQQQSKGMPTAVYGSKLLTSDPAGHSIRSLSRHMTNCNIGKLTININLTMKLQHEVEEEFDDLLKDIDLNLN